MRLVRFRLSTFLMLTAFVAAIVAFRRLKPKDDGMAIVPFDMLTILLVPILVIFFVMLQALWRK